MNGNELRNFRERRGWTQQRLGRVIGVSRTTISGYERGPEPVPRLVELAIAAVVLSDAARLHSTTFAQMQSLF